MHEFPGLKFLTKIDVYVALQVTFNRFGVISATAFGSKSCKAHNVIQLVHRHVFSKSLIQIQTPGRYLNLIHGYLL